MTNSKIKNLEQRVSKYRASISEELWQDKAFLLSQAKDIEEKDLALAFRLCQRVHNLDPEFKNVSKKLKRLSSKLNKESPDLMHSSSSEVDNNMSSKSRIISGRINQAFMSLAEKYSKLPKALQRPIVTFVVLPWVVFSLYQIFWATPRYESQSQLIVKQPDASATLDMATAVLSGVTGTTTDNDSLIVEAYIRSADMLEYLQNTLDLRGHYTQSNIDIFSRLYSWSSQEDFLSFYLGHISVEIDSISSVITLHTQGFTPEFAQLLNQTIVSRAEWYINNIGHQLATAQLKFIQKEHQVVEAKLQKVKSDLLQFQERYRLLDPMAEGAAFQQITYAIESQLSAKRAELKGLTDVMSEHAPEVQRVKREIAALEEQLKVERSRIAPNEGEQTSLSVGEILAKYSEFQVELELANRAYASSLVSLEKSRVEAYRKLQYLVTIESPTLPDDNKYPQVLYNLTLFGVVIILLFGVVRIVIATIRELDS